MTRRKMAAPRAVGDPVAGCPPGQKGTLLPAPPYQGKLRQGPSADQAPRCPPTGGDPPRAGLPLADPLPPLLTSLQLRPLRGLTRALSGRAPAPAGTLLRLLYDRFSDVEALMQWRELRTGRALRRQNTCVGAAPRTPPGPYPTDRPGGGGGSWPPSPSQGERLHPEPLRG